jgi:hypothetical protein
LLDLLSLLPSCGKGKKKHLFAGEEYGAATTPAAGWPAGIAAKRSIGRKEEESKVKTERTRTERETALDLDVAGGG